MYEKSSISAGGPESSEESAAERRGYSQHQLIVPDSVLGQAEQILKELSLHHKKRELRAREYLENGAWIPGEYILSIFSDAECSEPISRDLTGQVLEVMLTSKVSARFAESADGSERHLA